MHDYIMIFMYLYVGYTMYNFYKWWRYESKN